ncbi:MAG: CoA transferase [Acidimicrobiales bacterium]
MGPTPELASVFTDTSPYLPEMNANKRSVGLNLKSPAALAAVKEADRQQRRVPHQLLHPGRDRPGAGRQCCASSTPPDLRRPAGVRLRPVAPVLRVHLVGPQPGPAGGPRCGDRLRRPGTGRHRRLRPTRLLRRPARLHGDHDRAEHRDRTGEGCWVDLSQFEITVSALAPYVLDQQLSGEVVGRSGNRVDWYAPQGVYPCTGTDRWVAITAHDDDAWRALVALIEPGGALAGDPALATLEGRQADDAHDRIDAAIAAWTATRSPEAAAAALQAVGVAAYPVHSPETQLTDAQLTEYGWYRALPSFRFPDGDLCGGSAMRLHGTPGRFTRGAPTMGEHTVDVLAGVAGLAAGTIDDLLDEGAAFTPTAPDLKLHRPYEHVLRILGLDEEDPA